MNKLLLAGIATLSVLSASEAHAREWQGNMPKPVGKLPPYPPVVCVTPNWTPEPCESRQPSPKQMLLATGGTAQPDSDPWAALGEALKPFWEWLAKLPKPVSEKFYEPSMYFHPDLNGQDYLHLRRYKILPPLQYDHPFNGRLGVFELKDRDDVVVACKMLWEKIPNVKIEPDTVACVVFGPAIIDHDYTDCTILRPSDQAIWESGLTPNLVMRHEIGHCNGWKNHDGMRSGYEWKQEQEQKIWAEKDRKAEEDWKEWQKSRRGPLPWDARTPNQD